MKKLIEVLAVLVVLVTVLTAHYPGWPMHTLFWFGCPGYNALGGCGPVTSGFIVGRLIVGVGALAALVWLIRWIFKKEKS